MGRTRILIVDDHHIVRDGLCAILSVVPGLEVVGVAENGQIAVEQARKLMPHIILMDLSMPVMSGTEATRAIKQRFPAIKIIALTANKSHEHVLTTLAAGASGYILKDDNSSSLLNAIESIINGNSYLSPGVCDKVLNGFLDSSNAADVGHSRSRLTSREREVIKLVAEGYKNREIANHLSLSIKTVEKHRSSLMNKLDLHCVSALTTYAIEHSLITI